MTEALVSIIIPNYNRALLVQETLQSILAQTLQNWEAIVIDDNSTDTSVEAVERLASADCRIKLLKRKRLPKGAPTCRNIGIGEATGEYIIFLDSDDLLAENCLAQRLSVASNHPEFDVFISTAEGFYEKPGDVPIEKAIYQVRSENTFYDFASGNTFFITGQAFWRKGFILANSLLFNETLLSGQDFHFHYQAYFKGARALFTEGITDHYIRWSNTNRISSQAKSRHYDESRYRILEYIMSQKPDQKISYFTFNKICRACYSYAYIWRMHRLMVRSKCLSAYQVSFSTIQAVLKLTRKMLRLKLKSIKQTMHVY